jgi:phosphatidylglycerol:prolipoprotein diacylglycerol transferase
MPFGVLSAVVVFDFDPVGVILGVAVRWQYVAVTLVIFATLVLAGAISVIAERRRAGRLMRDPERAGAVAEAARTAEETVRASAAAQAAGGPAATTGEGPAAPGVTPSPPTGTEPGRAASTDAPASADAPGRQPPDDRPWPVGLRADDLLFIVAGGIAGAVMGGRLGWVLLYVDWYRDHQASILDPAVGGLTLAGGVAGGVLAGIAMAAVLGAPVSRWLGVAVVPLLLALGLGKLAMVLGGAGQGMPSDASWATAYAGPGPWGSLAPLIPSHPAQVYEALTSGGALLVVLVLALVPAFRRHPAALFAAGIGLWAAGRFAVAFSWRDPLIVGDLNGDQLVTAGIVAVAAVGLVAIVVRARRRRAPVSAATPNDGAPPPAPPPDPAVLGAVDPSAATSGTGEASATAEP